MKLNPGALARGLALAAVLVPAASSADPRPAVVELFTSQGCSSCPPADVLLGELAGRHDVLALSMHVDYWDKYGWPDRFALPAVKQRQFAYVRHFGKDWVYTPDMVIDGHIDVLGVDRPSLEKQLAAPRSGIPVQIVADGAQLLVSVPAAASAQEGEVLLVSYQPAAVTSIGRGENAGRELHEANVVRSLAMLGHWSGAAAQWRVELKSLPPEADHFAVLVQEAGPGPIIGATSTVISR